MAIKGTLTIDKKEYRILNWNIKINQQVDLSDKPITNPSGGLINLTIETTGSTEFFDWAVSPDMTKDGKVDFQSQNNSSSLKSYEFSNAYCVDFYEEFESEGDSPMMTTVTISAMEIRSGITPFTKKWNK